MCIWELYSHSVSCVVVPVPTAVGEVRGCLWVRHLFVYMCICVSVHRLLFHLPAGAVLFPGCRCCSEITSCRLPDCLCIRGLQPFPVGREEETIGNRMSIPGRRGQRGLGEVEGGGRG